MFRAIAAPIRPLLLAYALEACVLHASEAHTARLFVLISVVLLVFARCERLGFSVFKPLAWFGAMSWFCPGVSQIARARGRIGHWPIAALMHTKR